MVVVIHSVPDYDSYDDYYLGIYENFDSIKLDDFIDKDFLHKYNEKHKNEYYSNLYYYKEFNTFEEYDKAEWRLV
jgi:hypothetical protein